jgi:uncharacterized protein YerC
MGAPKHIIKINEAAKLANRERNKKILELRIAGASERQIADEVGISDTQVHRVLHSTIEDMNKRMDHKAAIVKRLELERLDRMTLALFGQRGDPRTADSLLRIMERRARYLGIDAPTKIDTTTEQRGPVVIKHDLSKLTVEELDALIPMLEKAEVSREDNIIASDSE